MKKSFTIILGFTVLMFYTSCTDEYTICGISKNVNLYSDFYKVVNNVSVGVPVPSLSVSVLNGTVLYTDIANSAGFITALNPLKDSIQFVLSIASSLPKDTVTLKYTNQLFTISQECGMVNTYYLTNVYSTQNTIDTVIIANPKVDIYSTGILKIFY